MNLFDVVNKNEVDFVHIESLVKDSSGAELLEYFVWLKSNKLNLSGYKIRQSMPEAYDNLKELQSLNVASNFTVTDLQDSDILSAIRCQESISSKVLQPSSFVKVELKFQENSIYNILYSLVDSSATIHIDGSPGFSSVKNLHFNLDNLDIIWRYFNVEEGFRSYHVFKNGVAPNMFIRSFVELQVPNLHSHKLSNGEFEYTFNPNGICNDLPQLYVDGNLVNNNLSIVLLGLEVLVIHYSRYHLVDLKYKVCEALNQYLNNAGQTKYNKGGSYYSTYPVKLCTIDSIHESVTMSKLKRLFINMKFDPSDTASLVTLSDHLYKAYDQYIADRIVECLVGYIGYELNDIKSACKVNCVGLSIQRTLAGIHCAGLKEVYCKNRIFKNMYMNSYSRYESTIYEGFGINILTYQNQADIQDLLKNGMLPK